MVNPQQILQLALQRCKDPRMASLIQNNINNPQQLLTELCKQYPDQAKRIDTLIGQGQNPMNLVMQMLGKF